MNRRVFSCSLFLTVACALLTTAAVAQLRTLPQNAKLARVGDPQPLPFVQLNGNVVKLAPGGVIYDENNRSILHGALPSDTRVAYTVDLNGDVQRIYILTAQELAQINSSQ